MLPFAAFVGSATLRQPVCALSCGNTSALFNTSISGATGHGFPYWHSSERRPLGARDEDVEVGIIVQHGDMEFGEDFLCYVQNALESDFGADADAAALVSRAYIVAPQFWAADQQQWVTYLSDHYDLLDHWDELFWPTAEARE